MQNCYFWTQIYADEQDNELTAKIIRRKGEYREMEKKKLYFIEKQ